MENLFLVSRGLMGRSLRARARLASLLSDEHTRVTKRTLSSKLLTSLDPAKVGAIVIFCDGREGRAAAEGASGVAELIDRYLLAGGGVLALGPAELPESRAVERLRPAELYVHQTNEFSRVFDGIGNFELRDAVYVRLPAGSDDLHFEVAASASEAGAPERRPLVWTRYRGKGRLCSIGLELRGAALRSRPVELLLRQAVDWVLPARRAGQSV